MEESDILKLMERYCIVKNDDVFVFTVEEMRKMFKSLSPYELKKMLSDKEASIYASLVNQGLLDNG